MAQFLAEVDEQYWDMNTGAHRRPAPLVGPPSLVWHRAFWKPLGQTSREDWIKDLDRLLLCIIVHLSDFAAQSRSLLISPNIDEEKIHLFRHRSEDKRTLIEMPQSTDGSLYRPNIVSASIRHCGINFTFRAQIRSEFWTFGVYADFCEASEDHFTNDPILNAIFKTLQEIYRIAADRYESPEKKPLTLASDLYSQMIEAFRQYCDAFIGDGIHRVGGWNQIHERCGSVFGDFVGVILGMRPSKSDEGKTLVPVLSTRGQPIPEKVEPYRFEKEVPLRILDAIWPIVRRLHGGFNNNHKKIEDMQGKPEYAVSLFQRGRVLYVSALGRLISRKLRKAPEPVIYTLVSVHSSRWQLGRLADRLHELGTLRLAAVRDLQKLMQANEDLRVLRLDLLKERKLSEIQSDLLALEGKITGGLAYRVERSRYYVGRFQSVCQQLGLGRVEGFQQYDEFVERRLSDKFDLIDKVGVRYDDLRRALRDKERSELQKHLKNQNETTHKLLETAEFIITIPLIYYIGMIIKYLTHIEESKSFLISSMLVISILLTRLIYKYYRSNLR